MKKICHVTSAHQRNDIRILKKECVSLAKKIDYSVFFVLNDALKDEECNGVEIISSKKVYKSRLARMIISPKRLYKIMVEIDADIYHFHDPELLPIAIKIKKRGKKVIFDSHELYREQIKLKHYIPNRCRNLISKLYERYENKVLAQIDGVIFPCTINGVNPFEGKCRHISLIDNLPIIEGNFEKINGAYSRRKTICYTGSISFDRGIKEILEAVVMTNSKLILAGNFANEDVKDFVLSNDKYKENVDYRGVCQRHEIYDIYRESGIGVSILKDNGQYNKGDNLPTKVYEYMSVGLPVIMNHSHYNDKIVNEYKMAILTKNDVESLAEAIVLLQNNEDLFKKCSINSKLLVDTMFNWEFEEKNLFNLYEKIFEEK